MSGCGGGYLRQIVRRDILAAVSRPAGPIRCWAKAGGAQNERSPYPRPDVRHLGGHECRNAAALSGASGHPDRAVWRRRSARYTHAHRERANARSARPADSHRKVTGALGTVGVGRAVRAAPDGYTVSVGNWPTHVVNGVTFALQYDVLRDFDPVALLSSNPYVVVARKDLPAKDLKELIAFLKANPENLTQGTAGPGSGQHVSGLYFQKVTGASLQFVPYRAGSSDIMKDLVGGHIDLTFDQAISALPHVRS
jgi:hypothetical protein